MLISWCFWLFNGFYWKWGFWCIPSPVFCVVQPCLFCVSEKHAFGWKNIVFVDLCMIFHWNGFSRISLKIPTHNFFNVLILLVFLNTTWWKRIWVWTPRPVWLWKWKWLPDRSGCLLPDRSRSHFYVPSQTECFFSCHEVAGSGTTDVYHRCLSVYLCHLVTKCLYLLYLC